MAVSHVERVGRASTSSSVHVLKSSDLATWIRLPLPLVPKAYHLLSAAFMKLGSGKSVFRPSHGPFARFWNNGEPSTAGSRHRVTKTHIEGNMIVDRYMLVD
jgi:hypothetical protein